MTCHYPALGSAGYKCLFCCMKGSPFIIVCHKIINFWHVFGWVFHDLMKGKCNAVPVKSTGCTKLLG